MPEPTQKLGWRPPPAVHIPEVPFWRDVPRMALLLAAICLLLGSLLPWAEGREPLRGAVSFRATQGLGEGVVLVAGAILLLFLARGRDMWESTSRTLQLLPLGFALIGIAMWLGIDNHAQINIRDWTRRGGSGELTNVRYVAAMGLALTLIATTWLEWHRPRAVKQVTGSLAQEWGLTRATGVTIVSAIAFGLLGAGVGVLAMVFLLGMEAILLSLILGVFGLFGGIAVGVRFADLLRSLRRR
jgi:hypothetical protein